MSAVPVLLATAGCDATIGHEIADAASRGVREHGGAPIITEPLGKDYDGGRFCTLKIARRITGATNHRFRMFASVTRQGFELCGARERPAQTADSPGERSLEPLLPGFICASAAMSRVADQIQRFQGHKCGRHCH